MANLIGSNMFLMAFLIAASACRSDAVDHERADKGGESRPIATLNLSGVGSGFDEFAQKIKDVAEEDDFAIRTDRETQFIQLYREDVKVFIAFKSAGTVFISIFRTCDGSPYSQAQIEQSSNEIRARIDHALE